MTVARTAVPLVVASGLGLVDKDVNQGMLAHALDFGTTDSSDTASAIYLGGGVPLRLDNNSGGSVTLTFYNSVQLNGALSKDGVANSLKDQDGVAVLTMTIADGESYEFQSGLWGITWLVIVGASAVTDGLSLTVKR